MPRDRALLVRGAATARPVHARSAAGAWRAAAWLADDRRRARDTLAESGELEGYHLLPAVRADLLLLLGRPAEAAAEFDRAAASTQNAAEQGLLRERAAAC